MNKFIKILFITLSVLLFVFILSYKLNNTKDTVQKIKERGEIFVGTTGDYQPMSYFNPQTKTYVGFDVELIEDLAKDLNVKIKYIPTTWPTLMADTIVGKFDLAICGITITNDRKKQALMSNGYLRNGKTVLCRKEDLNKYVNLESINKPEVRVMENPGGLNEKFAREKLPKAILIIHNINQEIPELIANGKADVMITEKTEAIFYASKNKNLAVPLAKKPFTKSQIGILLPKENKMLLKYVNKFLSKERNSGRLKQLEEKYIKY